MMLLDPARLVSDLGWVVTDDEILVRRPNRVVACVSTDAGPLAVKADLAAGSFAPEVVAIRRLAALGLPVPVILGHTLGPPAVLVLEWIEEDCLSSSSPRTAQHDVGVALRRLHAVPAAPPFSGQDSIGEWIAEWTDSIASWVRHHLVG